MPQINVQRLFEDTRAKLELSWVAGATGGERVLTSETVSKPSLALIGHLNFVHPNRVQVLGCAEMDYLRGLDPTALNQAIDHLYSTELAAIVIANGESVPQPLLDAANRSETPLFTSPQASPTLMQVLSHYLAKVLADFVTVHGVFMEVMGIGVLITGESAIGKSELALELITRGHRLIADDIVEIFQISPDTLEGRCPSLLQDFIEVRGLGILNIRALYGEVAVKPKKTLRFIVHLEQPEDIHTAGYDRLHMQQEAQQILGVSIPKARLPVAAGRNIAVLVEVAVRSHILQLRGISSSQQFLDRHDKFLRARDDEPEAEDEEK
jgi:HPr kinase/phosphorylase